MENRLKQIRKAKRITQQAVADHIGINQNTYSYWESGKTKIDSESMLKLSNFFGVSVDFLSGKRYKVTVPPRNWPYGYGEDYQSANEYEKILLEYLYGKIQYIDDVRPVDSLIMDKYPASMGSVQNEQENTLLKAFRGTTEEGRMRIIQAVLNICDDIEREEIKAKSQNAAG